MSQQYPPYPPAGAWPPGPPPGYPPYPTPTGTSAAAVASLVFGLILCIPGLTGLIAVICGAVGIGATKNPAVHGRGMAVSGFILGILNIVLWGTVGIGAAQWWKMTVPQRALGRQFITDLSQGNKDAAIAECTNNVTADQLDQQIDWFKTRGPIQKTMVFGNSIKDANGAISGAAYGFITFSNGQGRSFNLRLIDEQGTWKVDAFQFQ